MKTDIEITSAFVGEAPELNAQIHLEPYNEAWPRWFEVEADKIRKALGDKVVVLEHVGSTSVPGLTAKPRLDIVLVVPDSADEGAYVPALEDTGYELQIREPDWHEHRCLKGFVPDVNLHVFSPGSPETERMLLFRDWLRSNTEDRDLYERTKKDLGSRVWKYTQNYADAKGEVVETIIARARQAREC